MAPAVQGAPTSTATTTTSTEKQAISNNEGQERHGPPRAWVRPPVHLTPCCLPLLHLRHVGCRSRRRLYIHSRRRRSNSFAANHHTNWRLRLGGGWILRSCCDCMVRHPLLASASENVTCAPEGLNMNTVSGSEAKHGHGTAGVQGQRGVAYARRAWQPDLPCVVPRSS